MENTEIFEKKENTPLETYTFTYSEAEYDEINKSSFSSLVVRAVVFGILAVAVTVGVIIGGEPEFFGGFLSGWTVLYFILSLVGLLKGRKNWKTSKAKICSGVYKYEVFEDHMFLTVTRNGECEVYSKLEYENLNWKKDTGRFYLLAFANNQLYIVKKQEIAENSIFHSLKAKAPEKPSQSLKSLSVVLLVFSVVSGVVGMFFAMSANMFGKSSALSWWHPVAFSVIPVASVIFGFYLKNNHRAGKGNVISGLLITAFVFIIFSGFGAFESEDMAKTRQIEAVESYLGVELPDPYEYDNFKYTSGGVTTEDTAMQFYSKDIEYLENIILSDEKWADSLNSETNELVAKVGVADDWDYVCVYNITEDEYNKVPEDNGIIYRMAAMYWETDCNGLYVIEYNYFK